MTGFPLGIPTQAVWYSLILKLDATNDLTASLMAPHAMATTQRKPP